MNRPKDPALESVLTWTEAGQPRSRLYGDVYFSAQDGLAEARAVFLQGCGLPQAWTGRRRFVVGELGFGSGLNILALLDLWRTHRPVDGQLHVFSVEAHPLTAEEAARAVAAWPELADLAALLTARWPGRAHGFHRIDLPELDCILDVAVMEAGEALAAWSGKADAWFLDGFSPALNPAMWRDEVLREVAACSAPGARVATFTVAGQVRRGLAQAGFETAKKPGYGRKRERLEAIMPGAVPKAASDVLQIAVVGAGIAGAAAARAVRALGAQAVVIEADAPGAGASGNPLALVTPRLDAGLDGPARLFARAFARAVVLYERCPRAVVSRGVLQLAKDDRDPARFAKIEASDLFEARDLEMLGAGEVEGRIGEPAPAALELSRALVVSPAELLGAWSGEVRRARVAGLRQDGGSWVLLDAQGAAIARADAVILACGMACRELAEGLSIAPVRGQASWARVETEVPAASWGGYAAAGPEGLLFGATHDRGDEGREVRAEDHARNLATLVAALPGLAARLDGVTLEGRAGVRAVTPDYLPLAGPAPNAPPGLFVLSGLGSRGFTLAPLLAEHVAAQALGAPSPLPQALQDLVAPDRFARRAARRGRS